MKHITLSIFLISFALAFSSTTFCFASEDVVDDDSNIEIIEEESELFKSEFGVGSASGGTNTEGHGGVNYISVTDNINLFVQPSSASLGDYKAIASYPTTLSGDHSEGYGVITEYQNQKSTAYFAYDHQSNVRGSSATYGIGAYSFEFEIAEPEYIVGWSPKGTTTSSSDGVTVSVSLPLQQGGTLGTSFKLMQKLEKVTAVAEKHKYNIDWLSSNGVKHPNTVNLNSVVNTHAPNGNGHGSWRWSWQWYWLIW